MALVSTSTVVYCTSSFIAFHRWLKAPSDVAWLRDAHRHVFHVKVYVEVNHNDRAVEFQTLKQELDHLSRQNFHDDSCKHVLELSCEMIACQIGSELAVCGYKIKSVEVSEDGENGAIVTYA